MFMTHDCNPNKSRDRDRRITSSMSARAKLVRNYLKNKIQTPGLGTWFK
jgi:hypothetical protein